MCNGCRKWMEMISQDLVQDDRRFQQKWEPRKAVSPLQLALRTSTCEGSNHEDDWFIGRAHIDLTTVGDPQGKGWQRKIELMQMWCKCGKCDANPSVDGMLLDIFRHIETYWDQGCQWFHHSRRSTHPGRDCVKAGDHTIAGLWFRVRSWHVVVAVTQCNCSML